MNIFYNKQGIGDVLLITLKYDEVSDYLQERKGDLVRIYDEKTGETIGFNLFHASQHVSLENDVAGPVPVTEELVNRLNEIIQENGFGDELPKDFSPKFVVGYVKEKKEHPKADKLSVCTVDVGDEELQIVCGAPNVDAGQKVVVAKIGAVMPDGLVIKPSELRGVASYGMICSARELHLPNAPQEKGILVLDDSYNVGEAFPLHK